MSPATQPERFIHVTSSEVDGSLGLCLQIEGNLERESTGEVKMLVQNGDDEKMNDTEIVVVDERECRICHMSLTEPCCGVGIELKCDCKGDLAAAHQHCADTWFKIKGNRSCEICGSIAHYEDHAKYEVVNNNSPAGPEIQYETPPSNNGGRRIMNFLLTCMILGFIISWLFHFHVLPP